MTTLRPRGLADQVAAVYTLYSAPSSPSAGGFRLATAPGRSFDDLDAAARAAAPTFR